METIYETDIPHLELIHRGKVRDVYAVGDDRLLLVATDRVSAFDRIMTTPIPGKGILLTSMSAFWFKQFSQLVNTHYISSVYNEPNAIAELNLEDAIQKRSVLVHRAKRLDIECIVRGYLTGSAWRDYTDTGELNGERLPTDMTPAQKFSSPRFTPSTKAEDGQHDTPLDQPAAEKLVGKEMYQQLKKISLQIYEFAYRTLQERGLLLVDTKFEFGMYQGQLCLIDEVLTSDSSRFWDEQEWLNRPAGETPEPLDKEYVRGWLRDNYGNIDEGNELPPAVVEGTRTRYEELYTRVVGSAPPL